MAHQDSRRVQQEAGPLETRDEQPLTGQARLASAGCSPGVPWQDQSRGVLHHRAVEEVRYGGARLGRTAGELKAEGLQQWRDGRAGIGRH